MIKLTKERWELIQGDYDEFMKFLEDYTEHLYQTIALRIPNMVLYHIKEQKELFHMIKKFYADHPEYHEKRGLVSQISNVVAAENPTMPLQEIFEETTKRMQGLSKENLEKLSSLEG